MPLYELNSPGDPTNPNDYFQVASASCATGTDEICTITANDNGSGKPVLTAALKDKMLIALHNRTPDVPTVYLRS